MDNLGCSYHEATLAAVPYSRRKRDPQIQYYVINPISYIYIRLALKAIT